MKRNFKRALFRVSRFRTLRSKRKIVAKLKSLGFIEKIEEHNNQIGYCYRCNNIVEPYISKQWFVKKKSPKKV